MPTVRQLAGEFGVSPGLVMKALLRLAVYTEGPHSEVHLDHAQRFRDEFAPKIKKAKPKDLDVRTDDTGIGRRPVRSSPRDPSSPTRQDHIIRMAHAHVSAGRRHAAPGSMLASSDRYPVLSTTPGLIHAIDPIGTRDGDPWSGQRVAGRHSFYTHPGPPAACGTRVRAILSDEFALDTVNPCPKCREAFESGRASRNPPRDWFDRFDCEDSVRVQINGVDRVEECCLRDFHRGRHRSHSGATWQQDGSDFRPASGASQGQSAG